MSGQPQLCQFRVTHFDGGVVVVGVQSRLDDQTSRGRGACDQFVDHIAAEQWLVRAFDPDNPTTEAAMPDTVANVRADTKAVLGVAGKRFRVFQNHEAFDFMESLVGDKHPYD